jgi:energy-coupling factor transporter transmembrane protein EcfT
VSRAAFLVTVQASVTISLTTSQAELLRFLADQGEPPRSVRLTNYAALHAQGLIYRGKPAKYQITELG